VMQTEYDAHVQRQRADQIDERRRRARAGRRAVVSWVVGGSLSSSCHSAADALWSHHHAHAKPLRAADVDAFCRCFLIYERNWTPVPFSKSWGPFFDNIESRAFDPYLPGASRNFGAAKDRVIARSKCGLQPHYREPPCKFPRHRTYPALAALSRT
jgi:hypothetical protein